MENMEKKTKVRIYDNYSETEFYLLLRDNEIAFLTWLYENDFLSGDVGYTILDKETQPIEF